MPQDNTQIDSDNNQAVAQVPPSNDAINPVYASVPVEPVAPVDNPAPTAVPAEPPVSDVVVTPGPEPAEPEAAMSNPVSTDIRSNIATKIGENKNVLIALSSDPSVDELAAAIGLSLYLDRIGKRATAIYSGATPNTLEFLKPEETFEPSADTLQDFVIAINKEKADHLRYKVDGDYVKVYITPYKQKITEKDLEFSYGDYNVDLVIALDVANGIDLDSALREHGRIMHDASIINVTTGNPGKFGEIEWSDKTASSVSEMIANLLYDFGGEDAIAKDEATAFLTGVVAATNRFSNPKTTPETMRLSSRLMESGANQVLVSKNITPDTENEIFSNKVSRTETPEKAGEDDSKEPVKPLAEEPKKESEKAEDPTNLEVEHKHDERVEDGAKAESEVEKPVEEKAEDSVEVNADVTKKEHTLLDDLKAAEETLSHTGAETTPMDENKMLTIENGQVTSGDEAVENEPVLPEPEMPEPEMPELETAKPEMPEPVNLEPTVSEPVAPESVAAEPTNPEPVVSEPAMPEPEKPEPVIKPVATAPVVEEAAEFKIPVPGAEPNMNAQGATETDATDSDLADKPELVIKPSSEFNTGVSEEDSNKYGQMLQDALSTVQDSVEPSEPIMSAPDVSENPAASGAPVVPTSPEINGVPEMSYVPAPEADLLPPPPTPPIADMSQAMPPADGAEIQPITPATPAVEPEPTPLGEQPAMQDQVYNPQANDPGAFKIPGM